MERKREREREREKKKRERSERERRRERKRERERERISVLATKRISCDTRIGRIDQNRSFRQPRHQVKFKVLLIESS